MSYLWLCLYQARTGMYSLKYINNAMVTILKNVTNILTAIGELYLFRKHQNPQVWAAIFLMDSATWLEYINNKKKTWMEDIFIGGKEVKCSKEI
ncbi:GDP-mannose transporter GONST2-like isoform X3 [Apium graveolens]|uniref:GDP-mannose transporter GONST2-like isoform X3 n=1 Tax=Apium graveolens TaxID=4045 RepID=UPI003D7AD069